MVRLVNPVTGAPAAGVTPDRTRQLTLNEVLAPPVTVNGVAYPGGPLEILVNNTRYDGTQVTATSTEGVRSDFTASSVNGITSYLSELPNKGETELWEIVNLTADAHPIRTHLTQFQLMNRQPFNTNHGFAWHCHIIDDEDNEMMRPYRVTPKSGATRSYQRTVDY